MNNVNYNEVQPEEVPKKAVNKKPSLILDSNKLLEKIKKGSLSSSSSPQPSNFNLDSNLLLQKIKQGLTVGTKEGDCYMKKGQE